MRHRKPPPLKTPAQNFVMTVIALLCVAVLVWATGTVLAWLLGVAV